MGYINQKVNRSCSRGKGRSRRGGDEEMGLGHEEMFFQILINPAVPLKIKKKRKRVKRTTKGKITK